MPKITFIGAGSTVFMKNIIGDLLQRPALSAATIALMDLNPERLAESEIVAGKLVRTLGAQAKDVVAMIMRQGIAMVVIGLVIGIVAALALGRVLTSVLYGVTATDPVTFAGVVLVLLAVAAAATVIPAVRALRIEPTIALKAE